MRDDSVATTASPSIRTSGLGRKLRLGLLLNSTQIPKWAHVMLSKIAGSDYATINLVIFNESNSVATRKTFSPQLTAPTSEQTFTAYHRINRCARLLRRCIVKVSRLCRKSKQLDARAYWTALMNEPAPDPNALEVIDAMDLIRDIPAIRVRAKPTQFGFSWFFRLTKSIRACAANWRSSLFDEEAIASVKAYNLDVLLHLGFPMFRGEVLNAARFGIWSFDHDSQDSSCGPAGVWEVLEGDYCTACVLRMLGDEPSNAIILARSW